MSISSTTLLPVVKRDQLYWPKNPETLGLNDEKITRLHGAIQLIKPMLGPKRPYHSCYKYVKNVSLMLNDGSSLATNRSVLITHDLSLVNLKGKETLPSIQGGAQRKRIKYAFEAESGQLWVKKKLQTPFETQWYNSLPFAGEKVQLFAPIGPLLEDSNVVYEKKCTGNLKGWVNDPSPIDLTKIIDLQLSLKYLHSIQYQPAQFIFSDGKSSYMGFRGPCYHGDISPANILYDTDKEGNTSFYLTDFGYSCSTEVAWTPGWGSPETIAYVKGKKYTEMNGIEFNQKFGQARDLWSLGLIIGSILRSGFHPGFPKKNLPCFSFISSHILDADGNFQEEGLLNLTQEEIDDKLDTFIKEAGEKYGKSSGVTLLWKLVKGWLRIDPEERVSLETNCLTYSSSASS